MPIIKAEQLARGAHFVLPDSAGCAYVIHVSRTNGLKVPVSAAEVDRLLDEHDELEQLRARLDKYESRGPLVDLGAETPILVNADQVQVIARMEIPEFAGPAVRTFVRLDGDKIGLMSIVPAEEIAFRVGEARRQRAERGR